MSDIQLSLFPGSSGGPREIWPEAPGELPRRIPAGGVELVTSLLGTPLHCRLRRSPRARRLRLLVDRSATLTVVLPRRFPLREVPRALEENAHWILRTLERHRSRPAASPPRLGDGREIHLLGSRHVVRVIESGGLDHLARVWRRDGEILVQVPPLHRRSAAEMVRSWLRAFAAEEIPPRVRSLNETLRFPLKRIIVRDQKTKWGACSAAGNLSFNCRLVLAPVEVLDYVIVHELCHLRELNHSRRFWELLRSLRPEFERERVWLKENGDALDL